MGGQSADMQTSASKGTGAVEGVPAVVVANIRSRSIQEQVKPETSVQAEQLNRHIMRGGLPWKSSNAGKQKAAGGGGPVREGSAP